MDDFLREIQTSLFREWINNQKRDYYHLHQSETDPDAIIIENEYCYSYVTFNPQCIIELCVMNKRTDEMAFYLHFQFKTLKHAISLFEEMDQCIKKMIDQPICRLLLCCSGGMTTAFFADKIKNGIKVLNLNMEVAATSYQKIYNVAQNYDVILLAPQVSHVKLQVEKVFKNKLVLKIPTQIFASYNVGALITFIEESLKHKENKYNGYVEPLASMMEIKTNKNVLAVSINANGENSHISYRLYNSHQDIVLDSNIIKSNIKLQDVLDALDTVVLQNEMIDVISIALPGVMVEGNVYSGIIEGGNHQLKERLEKRYEKEIYLINDVNAAVVGYYASQNEYMTVYPTGTTFSTNNIYSTVDYGFSSRDQANKVVTTYSSYSIVYDYKSGETTSTKEAENVYKNGVGACDNKVSTVTINITNSEFDEGTFTVNQIIDGESSAIDNNVADKTTVKVYPNPVKDILNFSEVCDVTIVNGQGSVVKAVSATTQISVDDLAAGYYIAKIKTADGTTVIPFIKK